MFRMCCIARPEECEQDKDGIGQNNEDPARTSLMLLLLEIYLGKVPTTTIPAIRGWRCPNTKYSEICLPVQTVNVPGIL